MSVHDGHRQRLKKQYAEHGLESFTDIQILELLLFYVIPRRDTNPIAHSLLERFGSLSGVLEAPTSEIAKVEGMGESTAVFLHLVMDVSRSYMIDRAARVQILPTLESCAEYLVPQFFGRTVETVFLLCLDAKCKVLSCRQIAEGNVNTTGISVRKVVEHALMANASAVVLAHNHPGGVAIPSREDIQTTRYVASALRAVEVNLVDHVIVADDDYVSLIQSGYRFD